MKQADIRKHNFLLLLKEHGGKQKDFGEALGTNGNTISHIKNERIGVSDNLARTAEEIMGKRIGWMDVYIEGETPNLPAVVVKKRKKKDPVKTGNLSFSSDGFDLNMELRGNYEEEGEVTRLALRIIELRSR